MIADAVGLTFTAAGTALNAGLFIATGNPVSGACTIFCALCFAWLLALAVKS